MNHEALENFIRLVDLVEANKLPNTALPRLMYQGAKVVHTYARSLETQKFRCVLCEHEGTGLDFSCGCETPEIYCINYLNTARWECSECSHQWDGEDGTVCLQCGKKFK